MFRAWLNRVWAQLRLIRAWYFYCFLGNFLIFLPLPLVLVFLFAMLISEGGDEYGVDKLLWHDDWWRQGIVGVACAILTLEVLFVGYLLWVRDRRLQRALGDLPLVPFRLYAWRILGNFLFTAGAAWVLLKVVGWALRLTYGMESSSMLVEEPPGFPHHAPGALLLLTFLGVWLYERILHSSGAGLLKSLAWFTLGAATILLYAWWREPTGIDPAEVVPPGPLFYVSLLLGAYAVVFVLWVGARAWDAVLRWDDGGRGWRLAKRLGERLERAREWVRQYRTNPPARDSALRKTLLSAFLTIWLWLLYLSIKDLGSRPDRWPAAFFVTLGLGITVYPYFPWVRPPRRVWFSLALLANLLAAYAGITWLTSILHEPGDWSRVGISLLALPLFPSVFFALLLYDPAAAADFLDHRPRDTRDDPAPSQDEQAAWRHAGIAFLGGWLFFALVCNCPWLTSPVPIVFALVFLLVAAYGVVRHSLRRWLSPILGLLVLMAILSGLHPYKFRYEAFWPRYHDPVQLGDSLTTDLNKAKEQCKAIVPYLLAAYEVDSLQTRISWMEEHDNKPGAGEDDESRARLRQELKEARGELEVSRGKLKALRAAAKSAVVTLATRTKVSDWWQHVARIFVRQVWDSDTLVDMEAELGSVRRHLLELMGDDVKEELLLDAEDIKPGERKPMIVIAVKGGGLRSAVWTLRVLHELERRFAKRGKDFPAHVRLIAGASGGMLGAACYVGQLDEPDKWKRADREDELRDQMSRLEGGFINPLMQQFIFGDVPNWFSPWPARCDRGLALERAWAKAFGPTLNVTFEQLREREKQGWCPSLVFAPMMVEDGRRLIVSNLELASVISNDGPLLHRGEADAPLSLKQGTYSIEALQLLRLLPEAKRMPLRTAARMSASFPYFSPAVSLPTQPRRRVVDAGYYDNYGVSLVASWLATGRNHGWLKKNVSRVCLIQIRDGIDDRYRRLTRLHPDRSTSISRAVEEIASPPEAMDAARLASSSFRNDGQLEVLATLLSRPGSPLVHDDSKPGDPPPPPPFFVVNLEYSGRAELNWKLSKRELLDLKQKVEKEDETIPRKIETLLNELFRERPANEP